MAISEQTVEEQYPEETTVIQEAFGPSEHKFDRCAISQTNDLQGPLWNHPYVPPSSPLFGRMWHGPRVGKHDVTVHCRRCGKEWTAKEMPWGAWEITPNFSARCEGGR